MKNEKIKEFIPTTSKNLGKNFNNETFEIYEITTNAEKLKVFRREYINNFVGNPVNRIISSSPAWFNSKGLFDPKKDLKGSFFELGISNIKKVKKGFIESFIELSPLASQVKAIKFEGKNYFIYTNSNITKKGSTYQVEPCIIINEDIYNMAKILSRDFSSLTVDDLSKYKEFFKVSDKSYLVITENWLEDLYRNGDITKEEYQERINRYRDEVRLTKTLR